MTSIDELKARADELGIQYGARIGAETLAERIAEAEKAQGADDSEKPAEPVQKAAETPAEKPAETPKASGLDRDRPYAQVLGNPGPARYCQDGKFYDINGKPCQGI